MMPYDPLTTQIFRDNQSECLSDTFCILPGSCLLEILSFQSWYGAAEINLQRFDNVELGA